MKLENATPTTLRKALHAAYQDRCQYCHSFCDGDGHVDHIIPKARGGMDDLQNYTLACRRCNLRKAALSLPEAGVHLLTTRAAAKQPRILELIARTGKAAAGKPRISNETGQVRVAVDGVTRRFLQAGSAMQWALSKHHAGHSVTISGPPEMKINPKTWRGGFISHFESLCRGDEPILIYTG